MCRNRHVALLLLFNGIVMSAACLSVGYGRSFSFAVLVGVIGVGGTVHLALIRLVARGRRSRGKGRGTSVVVLMAVATAFAGFTPNEAQAYTRTCSVTPLLNCTVWFDRHETVSISLGAATAAPLITGVPVVGAIMGTAISVLVGAAGWAIHHNGCLFVHVSPHRPRVLPGFYRCRG